MRLCTFSNHSSHFVQTCTISLLPNLGGMLIIPMLICADTAEEIEFCRRAFGASVLSERVSTDGKIIHATLAIGAALFMVHGEISHVASREPQHDGSSSVSGLSVSLRSRLKLPYKPAPACYFQPRTSPGATVSDASWIRPVMFGT